ncbi:MAG TPA: hypothetical protein VFS76_19570 [Pyrinomonadaceae bacterium]|nr:hypothetical protein [Pyrinomonadaceae bacterium]
MRKLLCALSLISALVFALAVQAAAPTSFAGTWSLDKSKSQGLSPRFQNVESVSWTITQTDKTITIDEKIAGGGPPGGGPGGPGGAAAGGPPPAGAPGGQGGPGGGPGRGMGGGMGGPRVFNLDGSETSGETGRGKFVRKATWSSDGKTLDLATKTTVQGPEGEMTFNSNDKLAVSEDGKTLTVTRHSEGPRGNSDSTWVMNKN